MPGARSVGRSIAAGVDASRGVLVSVTLWDDLPEGAIDPWYQPWDESDADEDTGGWCHESGPDGWFCSRTPGHQGRHVACGEDRRVLESWPGTISPDLVLPEGF